MAITGKRAIPADQRDRIGASLAQVFEAFARLLIACQRDNADAFSDEPPLLRIISGMAEGADQLAAEVALERYDRERQDGGTRGARKIETRLAAILPFPRAEFEKDFKQDPERPNGSERTDAEAQPVIARFRSLLNAAAVESVLEIDDEVLLSTGKKEHRDQAYANQGDLMLDHADVLVAISDDRYGGAGGTLDVVRMAAGSDVPVVQISTLKPGICVMVAPDPDDLDQTLLESEKFDADGALPPNLSTRIARNLEPPTDLPEEGGAPGGHHAHAHLVQERLRHFFAERFVKDGFGRVFKAFRAALTVQPDRRCSFCWKAAAAFGSSWKTYPDQLKAPDQLAKEIWPDGPNGYDRFSRDSGAAARRVLADRYGWADALAIRYADAARSAHIIIAALGAFAVLIALLPLILPQTSELNALYVKMTLLATEVAVLAVAAFAFFQPAHQQRWHERMVEYRALAELLRQERFIYALGGADRPGRSADQTWSEPDAWVGWYARATLRELGFPSKVLDAQNRRDVLETFLKDELAGENGQVSYNGLLAERFETVDHRLEKAIGFGFWLTVSAAALGVVVFGSFVLFIWTNGLTHETEHHIESIKPWFTVIAAFVPALIAAMHGIRFQIEFSATAGRAEKTKRELLKISERIANALARSSPPGRQQAVGLIRAANQAMSDDLAGWSNVYRGKGPELG